MEDETMTTETETRSRRKMKTIKTGRVVSNRSDKTVVVAVDYLKPHPLYRKIIRKTGKFHAHDEENECQIGDTVRIEESRPMSRLKRWRVIDILERGEEA